MTHPYQFSLFDLNSRSYLFTIKDPHYKLFQTIEQRRILQVHLFKKTKTFKLDVL